MENKIITSGSKNVLKWLPRTEDKVIDVYDLPKTLEITLQSFSHLITFSLEMERRYTQSGVRMLFSSTFPKPCILYGSGAKISSWMLAGL